MVFNPRVVQIKCFRFLLQFVVVVCGTEPQFNNCRFQYSICDRGLAKKLKNLLHSASAFHMCNIFLVVYNWLMFFYVFFSNADNYGEGAKIKLDSNGLTYLDVAVFQSIVTGFKENRYTAASISVADSKKTIIKNYFRFIYNWKVS